MCIVQFSSLWIWPLSCWCEKEFYAENQNRHPNEAIKIAKQFVEEIEELTGRTVIIDESDPDSPNGRVYVKIDAFIANDRSTWNESISESLDCMEIFVRILSEEI